MTGRPSVASRRVSGVRRAARFVLGAAAVALAACGGTDDAAGEVGVCPDIARDGAPSTVALPPSGAIFDYQLGGAYDVPAGVGVVARDREDVPAPGVYGVCYVNAFQTQPGADWSGDREMLLLRDAAGRRVEDPDWADEYLFDLSTADKRQLLAAIVGGWVAQCAADGFAAVELDNLDSFTRAQGRFGLAETAAFGVELLAVAHQNALAVAQKNTAEASACFRGLGFDFAIAEECWYERECDAYTAAYADRVFDVEYDADAFEAGCSAGRTPAPIRRDRDLVPPGPDYVREQCRESGR